MLLKHLACLALSLSSQLTVLLQSHVRPDTWEGASRPPPPTQTPLQAARLGSHHQPPSNTRGPASLFPLISSMKSRPPCLIRSLLDPLLVTSVPVKDTLFKLYVYEPEAVLLPSRGSSAGVSLPPLTCSPAHLHTSLVLSSHIKCKANFAWI